MAAENRKFNISDCITGETEILSTKHTFLWSRNAMETMLITTCCPVTYRVFKIASKVAAGNRKLNISDCLADKFRNCKCKAYILWSRNALETKLITLCCPITEFAEIFKMASKMAAENRTLNIFDPKFHRGCSSVLSLSTLSLTYTQ